MIFKQPTPFSVSNCNISLLIYAVNCCTSLFGKKKTVCALLLHCFVILDQSNFFFFSLIVLLYCLLDKNLLQDAYYGRTPFYKLTWVNKTGTIEQETCNEQELLTCFWRNMACLLRLATLVSKLLILGVRIKRKHYSYIYL